MDRSIQSEGIPLAAHLARPTDNVNAVARGMVLCHGFPTGPRGTANSAQTYPELADRLAADTGWTVLSFDFRGTGGSEGDFSLAGWVQDLHAVIGHLLANEPLTGIWVAGSGTGGAVALCEAADDQRVLGLVTLAAPADFTMWAADPDRLLDQARRIGAIRDPRFPVDVESWSRELADHRPLHAAARIAPRPLLVVHGSKDQSVDVQDARAIADAAQESVELRILNEADHRLRHDPRAVALIMGWMERQGLD